MESKSKQNAQKKQVKFLQDNSFQDYPLVIEQFQDFEKFVQSELSYSEFIELHKLIGVNTPLKVTRLFSGVDFWTFDILVKIFRKINSSTLPSVVIEHFTLNHNLSQDQLKGIDGVILGF